MLKDTLFTKKQQNKVIHMEKTKRNPALKVIGAILIVAGVITSFVIFTSFPRIFKRREEEVKAQNNI